MEKCGFFEEVGSKTKKKKKNENEKK